MLDKQIEAVANSLGVKLEKRELAPGNESGYSLAIALSDLKRPHGFEFRVREGLLSWTFDLYLDSFSGEFLNTLRMSFYSKRDEILGLFEVLANESTDFDINVNDLELENVNSEDLWHTLEIRSKFRVKTPEAKLSIFEEGLLATFSILMELISSDPKDLDEMIEPGYLEGDKTRITVNHYERSRVNRALCLKWHGFDCKGCGLNMSNKYGPIGEGVIHVHHLTPVSQMGERRRLNPKTDLIPLCPNCHVIVHRKDPPLSLEDLKSELEQNF